MQDKHARDWVVEAYTYEQVIQFHGDVPMVVICGNGTDIRGDGVHIVREVEELTYGEGGGVKIPGSSTGPKR